MKCCLLLLLQAATSVNSTMANILCSVNEETFLKIGSEVCEYMMSMLVFASVLLLYLARYVTFKMHIPSLLCWRYGIILMNFILPLL